MKFVLCLFTLLFCTQVYADLGRRAPTDGVEWKEQAWSYFNGKSEIKVLKDGPVVELDVRFINGANDRPLFSNTVFFNAFFQNREGMPPATLALFNEKRKFVRNLPVFAEGAQTRITDDDWSYIPLGAYVGTRLKAMIEPGLPSAFPTVPPGTYYLQLIYNKSFIASRPQNAEELAAFRAQEKWDELFRSNAVKIKVSSGR